MHWYNSSAESVLDDKMTAPPSPTSSSSTISSCRSIINPSSGTHAVRYQPGAQWDCVVESGVEPIDVALSLPHFRARHQPPNHRMKMFIGTRTAPVRAQVCRSATSRQPFLLTVVSETEVTLYLPSDFKGAIKLSHPSSRSAPSVRLSVAFNQTVLPHATFSAAAMGEDDACDASSLDSVRICAPTLNLRVWDVMSATPERKETSAKGMFKRLLRSQVPSSRGQTTSDWDFLLD